MSIEDIKNHVLNDMTDSDDGEDGEDNCDDITITDEFKTETDIREDVESTRWVLYLSFHDLKISLIHLFSISRRERNRLHAKKTRLRKKKIMQNIEVVSVSVLMKED